MRIALSIVIALVVSLGSACDDPPKPPPSPAEEKDSPPTSAQAEPDAGDTDASARKQPRFAFGVPLPPQLIYVDTSGERSITAETSMRLDEVVEFYEARLTDYEILRDGDSIRLVGLRSGMTSVRGKWSRGSRSVRLHFRKWVEPDENARKLATPYAGEKPLTVEEALEQKKGEPVTLRLPDGTLMAPGAHWGEPYTPPEGSYLHQKRFKGNFGRPFGEWIPD